MSELRFVHTMLSGGSDDSNPMLIGITAEGVMYQWQHWTQGLGHNAPFNRPNDFSTYQHTGYWERMNMRTYTEVELLYIRGGAGHTARMATPEEKAAFNREGQIVGEMDE